MTYNYANMSMLEVAEHLMSRKKTPQPFKKIAQEVSELMGMSEDDLRKKITRFYADLTLSGKFLNVGGDKWDLKSRQKFEMFENQFLYDEENDIDDETIEEDDDLEEDDIDEEYEEEYDDGDDDLS
jgi:DNA-directed RNA polymerase subunit delta